MHLPFADISGQTFRQGRYKLLNILGSGCFGITYRGIDRSITSRVAYVAVKVQLKPERGSQKEEDLSNEVRLMMKAGQLDNVVKFRDFVVDEIYAYLVMDLCTGSNLQTCIDAGYFWKNDGLIKKVYGQILTGILHLHRLEIYHYDLKPENIMVSPDWKVTIIDLGLASFESDRVACGDTRCRPPESFLQGAMNGGAADIWALGMILVDMICESPLWYTADAYQDPDFQLYMKCRQKGVANFSRILPVSKEIEVLLQGMLAQFRCRPSINTVLKDFMEAPCIFDMSNLSLGDKSWSQGMGITLKYP